MEYFRFFEGEYFTFLFKKHFFQDTESELLTQHEGKLWEKQFQNTLSRIFILM